MVCKYLTFNMIILMLDDASHATRNGLGLFFQIFSKIGDFDGSGTIHVFVNVGQTQTAFVEGLLFAKGKILKKVPEDALFDELMQKIAEM